jgi:hypothetical protein
MDDSEFPASPEMLPPAPPPHLPINSPVQHHLSLNLTDPSTISSSYTRRSSANDYEDCLLSYAATLWRPEWRDSAEFSGELCKMGKSKLRWMFILY